MNEGRGAVGSVGANGIRTGRAVRGQTGGGCALPAVKEFALDLEPTVIEDFRGTPVKIIIRRFQYCTLRRWGQRSRTARGEMQYELDAR